MICVTVIESRSMGRICDSGSNEEIQMQQLRAKTKCVAGDRPSGKARRRGRGKVSNQVQTGAFIR